MDLGSDQQIAQIKDGPRKANYYRRLQEERKARKEATELLEQARVDQAKCRETIRQLEAAVAEAEETRKREEAEHAIALNDQRVRLLAQQNAAETRIKKSAAESLDEAQRRHDRLREAQRKEDMIAIETKQLESLQARLQDLMSEERGFYQNQVKDLKRSLEWAQAELKTLLEHKARSDEVLAGKALEAKQLSLRLRVALRAEGMLKSYRHLLKFLAVRSFVNSWKYRASFRRLHSALVGLVRTTFDIQQEAGVALRQPVQAQVELEAWLSRESQQRASKEPFYFSQQVAHLIDLVPLLELSLRHGRARERAHKETSDSFFSRNSELAQAQASTQRQLDSVSAQLAASQRQVALLQEQLTAAQKTFCPCARSTVCMCLCEEDCSCVVGGGAAKPAEPASARSPADKNEQMVKTLRHRLAMMRQAMTTVQSNYDLFRLKYPTSGSGPGAASSQQQSPVFEPRALSQTQTESPSRRKDSESKAAGGGSATPAGGSSKRGSRTGASFLQRERERDRVRVPTFAARALPATGLEDFVPAAVLAAAPSRPAGGPAVAGSAPARRRPKFKMDAVGYVPRNGGSMDFVSASLGLEAAEDGSSSEGPSSHLDRSSPPKRRSVTAGVTAMAQQSPAVRRLFFAQLNSEGAVTPLRAAVAEQPGAGTAAAASQVPIGLLPAIQPGTPRIAEGGPASARNVRTFAATLRPDKP